jgi:hypothetical protein
MTGFALAQTEFSADIVDHGKEKSVMTKIYAGKDKVRIDAPNQDGGVIMDLKGENLIVLVPEQHIYMVMPADEMEDRGLFHFFESGDVDNACAEWLKMAANKGGTCKKDGTAMVNGRHTVKYEGGNAKGESNTVWLDSRLRFPVKWEDKNGGGELENIQEGPQPASLFEIPAGFTKMDMGAMMRQHNK